MLLEDGDDGIDDGVLLSSASGFSGIVISLLLEVFDGTVHGVEGILPDGVNLGLSGDGSGLGDAQLLNLGLTTGDFLVKVGDFSLGVRKPSGKGESGGDLLLLEVGQVDVELVLKIDEEVVDLLSVGVTTQLLVTLVGGELGELLDGVSLEEVAVHRKSISDVGADLNEGAGLVGKVSTEILLEESNDLEGILMVLDCLDEEGVGVAALV